MPVERLSLSDHEKKRILGKQRYRCNNTITPFISDYTCPLSYNPVLPGVLDEAGCEYDHIVELAEGGSNDLTNFQALCVSCHRVKTARYNYERMKNKSNKTSENVEDEDHDDDEEDDEEETPKTLKRKLIFKELEDVQDGMRIFIRDSNLHITIAEGTLNLDRNTILHNGEEISANQFAFKYNKKNPWRDLRVSKDGNYIRLCDLK